MTLCAECVVCFVCRGDNDPRGDRMGDDVTQIDQDVCEGGCGLPSPSSRFPLLLCKVK